MKKIFPHLFSLITVILFALVLWRQIPLLVKSYQAEGRELPPKIYSVISSSQEIQTLEFPSRDKRFLTIFWATWCGPCKLEMHRLQSSIEDKKISASNIVAINPFEDPLVIRKFLKNQKFDFTFIHAPEIATSLQIEVTPTVLFIDKGKITSQSTGLSIIGIWKAENFLN